MITGQTSHHKASILKAAAEISANLQVPFDMSLNAILAAVATVCQGCLDASFPDGATIPTSLITITVAESGAGKTPCQKQANQAITQFQSRRKNNIDGVTQEANLINLKIWNLKNDAIKFALKKCISKNEESFSLEEKYRQHAAQMPKLPTEIITIYDNVSTSAIIKNFSERSPFAAIFNSDAGDAMRQQLMDQLTLFNKLQDEDPILKDRSTTHLACPDHPRLSMNLSVQPKSMRDTLLLNGGFYRISGFIPRALIGISPSNAGSRIISNLTTIPGNAVREFHWRSSEILRQVATQIDSGKIFRKVAKLSPTSEKQWIDFCQHVENHSSMNGCYADIQDHASKIGGLVLRIAALLEFFENNSLIIDPPQLQQAIEWGFMYLDNAKKLYQTSLDSSEMHKLATQLHGWISNECQQLGVLHISRSRVTSRCPYVFRKAPLLLEEVLDMLAARQEIYIFKIGNARCIRPNSVRGPVYASFPLYPPHP